MAISIKKYVDITSGVGGGAGVAQRDLIARVFSSAPILSPDTVYEFTSLADVLVYFDSTSTEYIFASKYFGTISKVATSPKKISFYRYSPTATFAAIFGAKVKTTLAQFTAVTSGTLTFTLDTVAINVTAIDLSTATTLAQVASLVQTKVIAAGVTGATVTFDAVASKFKLQTPAGMVISLAGGTTAALLGFSNGIAANGATVQTLTNCLTTSANISTNFGSYTFLDTLTIDDHVEIGTWNTTSEQNIMFIYMVRVLAANSAAWSAALLDYSGVCLNLFVASTDWLIANVMGTLAATDYNKPNSTLNFMFQQYAAPVTVTTTANSNLYDSQRVNYYGQTQTAGQLINFYQQGLLCGLATSPTDINVYANEMWLKDAATASILSLLLSMNKVSANATGKAMVKQQIIAIVLQALVNGTISANKPLNQTQKTYINTITNDLNAATAVGTTGYWLDVTLSSTTSVSGAVTWQANYLLVYAKDDVIRKVVGTHSLI